MKKMFKYFGLAAIAGLMALILWAPTASAQDDETVTITPDRVPAEVGTVSVMFTGSGFGDSARIAVTPCPGANGNVDAVNPDTALGLCPTIIANLGGGGVFDASGGSFSGRTDIEITQAAIDDGGIVLSVTEARLAAGVPSDTVLLAVGDAAAASDGPEGTEGADADTGATATDSLASTGIEAGLLAVAGISIVIAGFLFAGFSRRLRKN